MPTVYCFETLIPQPAHGTLIQSLNSAYTVFERIKQNSTNILSNVTPCPPVGRGYIF